jgi:hypothetical protein
MESPLSRRSFFKYVIAAGAITFSPVVLHAKTTKAVVKYQEKSTTGKKCQDCLHFIPETSTCKLVDGKINPKGWCTFYLNKITKKP